MEAEHYYLRRLRLLAERRARLEEWDFLAAKREHDAIADQVGPGWRPLVLELHAELLEVDPDYRLYDVREVDGELVVEARAADERAASRLTARARRAAAETCEVCGVSGLLRPERRQVKTLCDVCFGADRAEADRHGERYADIVLARLLSADDDHPSVEETLAWLDALDSA